MFPHYKALSNVLLKKKIKKNTNLKPSNHRSGISRNPNLWMVCFTCQTPNFSTANRNNMENKSIKTKLLSLLDWEQMFSHMLLCDCEEMISIFAWLCSSTHCYICEPQSTTQAWRSLWPNFGFESAVKAPSVFYRVWRLCFSSGPVLCVCSDRRQKS